ncbi:hypothetical protein A2773_06810 [Candidatus Gottesmanbacteria bacterium RIFCSPHIGHO2_01_FULL_39_10]|uniref:Type I restriction modification DNA specificity domain-containing protein n=1 Tax=Candidatus Gottesmanbacteria bacterium RIFCSPHIGHO2_01_FULL_39_10 TaxID=1798375 RepID=A0A1F5ZMK7_9BACT|nr:MAG: hypothetical protein A2773_06810 [Candidatus Gottesmanbacteria bacterium RIFCSPHIGHO2_01_FULL_39_10]
MITQRVYATDIEDRIDPHFYKHKYLETVAQLKRLKTPTKSVDSFSDVICGPFGSAIKVSDYTDNGVPLIRIENIDKTDGVSSTNATFISEKLASTLKSYRVNKGDLVISQRGTLGLCGVIRDDLNDAVISANLIAIKNLKEVNPDYLKFFFSSNLGQIQLERRTSGQVQTKITTEDIKTLLVPIPSQEIQHKIINTYLSALEDREEKLKQADELLNSIDGYVRQQLGITYTEPEEEKIYTVNSQDLEGNRQDPYYYNPNFVKAFNSLVRIKHKILSLGQLIVDMSGGATPEVEGDFYTDEKNGVPFLRVQNITKKGISLDDVKYIKKTVHYTTLKRSQLRAEDLVFTITGRIGSVAVVPNNFTGNINQHSVRIQLKDSIDGVKISPIYIATFLNSSFGQQITIRGITGGTRPALDYEYIKTIPIPLPDIKIQENIAQDFSNRVSGAEKLQNEASKLLEDAKKQVEEMILN